MKTRSSHHFGILPGVAFLVLSAMLASAAAAQTTGGVTGKVTSTDGKPLAYANVVIVGIHLGRLHQGRRVLQDRAISPGNLHGAGNHGRLRRPVGSRAWS